MASPTRNPARISGFETDQLSVRWTTNGANPASAGKARGNTVRRINRAGVGLWDVTFRAGVIPAATAVFGRNAHIDGSPVLQKAQVGSFTFASNGETTVRVTTIDAAGAASETSGVGITLEIDLELSSIIPNVDTLD